MTLSSEERKGIESKIENLSSLVDGIDKTLAPYRIHDTPTNNIYYWYGENTTLGEMLRTRDKLILRRHEMRVQLGIFPV